MQNYLLSIICYLLSIICGSRFCGDRRRSGFTLIEILIAITILLIIVILGSMVFQETTGAFQSGNEKVQRQVAIRNVLGSISRDMALAVSSSNYPGLPKNSFSGSKASFIALTGRPGVDLDGTTNSEVRTAQVISYSIGGNVVKREVKSTKCSNGKWSTGSSKTTSLNDSGTPISTLEFDAIMPDGDDDLPERVSIRAEVTAAPQFYSVGAGSGGKHGWDDEEDNIYVGYDPSK